MPMWRTAIDGSHDSGFNRKNAPPTHGRRGQVATANIFARSHAHGGAVFLKIVQMSRLIRLDYDGAVGRRKPRLVRAGLRFAWNRGLRGSGVAVPIIWVMEKGMAVGTCITARPPHRTGRARLRHPAPTLGV